MFYNYVFGAVIKFFISVINFARSRLFSYMNMNVMAPIAF